MRQKLFSVTIHDCRVDTFCSGGKGGQHQNATQSGVRIVHEPSGAIGECREDRHQINNKRTAFRRMAESPAFQQWARREAARLNGIPTVESLVEDAMQPEHLKVETRNARGQWEVDTVKN